MNNTSLANLVGMPDKYPINTCIRLMTMFYPGKTDIIECSEYAVVQRGWPDGHSHHGQQVFSNFWMFFVPSAQVRTFM